MISRESRYWRPLDATGSVAVEFAISMPLLVLIIAGIVDYGAAVNISTKLFSGARAAAQYALYHPTDTGGIQSAASNATNDGSMAVATPITVCKCIDNNGIIRNNLASCPGDPGTCTGGTAPYRIGHFLTVTTSETYTPTISITSLPVIGNVGLGTVTLNGLAQIQVQ